MITYDEFSKVEMLVGTITEVTDFPEAKKPAYRLIIDFGKRGTKKSSAQITDLYAAKDLIGRQVIAVTNFPSKQIASFSSECLVLGVYNEKNKVVLLKTSEPVSNGATIS